MRTARIAIIAFWTGFSGAIMPGPMLALVIGAVSAQGFAAVAFIVAGHALLELVTVALLIAGVSAALRRPHIRAAIGLIGGAALLWMGVDMLRNAARVSISADAQPHYGPWWTLVLAGAGVCVVNPYFLGWWATVGTGQMAHLGLRRGRDYLAFYIGHEMSDVVWYAFVGAIIAAGRGVLGSGVYHALVAACGATLVALSVWFIASGVRQIRRSGARLRPEAS